MRAASPPRSRSGVGCAAPLLLLATWLGECTAAVPPGWDITVSGGCNEATGNAGALTYTYQGTTDSDAPYYKTEAERRVLMALLGPGLRWQWRVRQARPLDL